MELRHLRYFHAVAELLNFSRAAERLHVAQPALSRQIRDLEAELGVTLFDRNRVRVQLTDAGRTFQEHVTQVLDALAVGVASVRATQAGAGGELIICNDWRLSIDLIPATVAEFRARHPRVEVVLRDLVLHQQLLALRAQRAHIGFLPREEISSPADFDSLPLFESEWCAVVGAGHSLARRRLIRIAELEFETWLSPTGDHAETYRTHVMQVCRLAGFSPTFSRQSATSLSELLGLIAAGFGVGLLPDFLRTSANPSVRFIRSDCAPVQLCAVWPRRAHSQLLQHYLAILRRHVAALPRSIRR